MSAIYRPTARFLFIGGPDDFLVSREANEVWKLMEAELPDELSREVVNGAANVVEDVKLLVDRFLGAVGTIQLFGDRKAVWFKGITFLGDSRVGNAEGILPQLDRLKKGLLACSSENVLVILSASPVDRRRVFYKWLGEAGEVRWCGESKGEEVGQATVHLIEAEARRWGVEFASGVAEYLAARVGGSPRMASVEVQKLAAYVGESGELVTEGMVADLTPVFGEVDFFEPVEVFYNRDLSAALTALRRYFFAGHEARPLLSAWQGRNRLLIQLRALIDAEQLGASVNAGYLERLASQYAHHYGANAAEKSNFTLWTQNPWYLGRLVRAARAFTLRRLVDCQLEFGRAFAELLSRPREEDEVVREMVIRCLGPAE